MIISDLIYTFNKAWKEVNESKIRSKRQISEVKELANEWKNRIEDIIKVEKILIHNWEYFPIEQRNDYIQKTYDLLHFGLDVEYYDDGGGCYSEEYGIGLIKIYSIIRTTILKCLTDMKNYYRTKDYKMVNSVYETCIEYIEDKLEQYHMYSISENKKSN